MKEIGSHGLIFGPEIQNGSNTILSNIERSRSSFFELRMYSNMFIYWWWSNSNTLFYCLGKVEHWTLNLLDLLNYSSNSIRRHFFWTSNELEHVLLLVIELEHPIFGFKRSNIELRTSLQIPLKFPSDRYLKPRS